MAKAANAPMRIVYNLRDQDWLTTKSLGILHVSVRVLAGLAGLPEIERIDVLANRSLTPHLSALNGAARCVFHYLDTPAPRGWARLGWDHWGLVAACNRLAPDWLLLPKGFSPLLRWPVCRVSAYVHDNVFGYYGRRGLRPFPRGQAALFTRMLRRTARRADCVVTNSAFTKHEFDATFRPRRPSERIGAPCPPPSPHTPKDHAATDRTAPSLLLPTSAWPHKLSDQAVAWLQRWVDETRFAGTIQGFGARPPTWPSHARWMHHGRVDDNALARLEDGATALIYFSDYEGYGLPPVEAAANGRRAIASALPALRETLPAEALFDNSDYASFARTLSQTLAAPARGPVGAETAPTVARRWLAVLQTPS